MRTAIAAIENAQAVSDEGAYSFVGIYPDVPRRSPGRDEVRVLEQDVADRREAMAVLAALARNTEAATLQVEIDILAPYVGGVEPL